MAYTTSEQAATPVAAKLFGDRFPQMLCAWCGPMAVVGAILGMVVVGGYVPATAPSASGAEIADWYVDHTTSIRFGMVISMIAFTLFVPFGVAIASQLRRGEDRPLLSNVQVACVAIAALEGVLACVIWATTAFRPGVIDPDITRALHDLGWFMFLFNVPPFGIWMLAVGISILRDPLETFPRWVGYFNLFAAFVIEPAFMIAFFKEGPFAYNGLFALYVPFATFFLWMTIMTPFVMRAIRRTAA